jgi:hypothetical protein
MRRITFAVVLAVLCGAGVTRADEPEEPASGIITASAITDAPMFVWADADRTPIRVVRSGEQVRVIGKEGRWFEVVYTDERFGEESGYMRASSLKLETNEWSSTGSGAVAHRGFVDLKFAAFMQKAANDPQQLIGDTLVREEARLKPSHWLELAGGVDLRSNSYAQVEEEWRLDFENRGTLRPRAAVRRLSATVNAGRFNIEAGNQFVRWGKADVLNPTDRFAPRDYLTVIDSYFLPVLGVRPSVQFGQETLEAVYLPRMTPSRLPLLNQRWTVVPPEAEGLTLIDGGGEVPVGSEQGVRWNHTGGRFEASASFFNGFNHLPALHAIPDLTAGSVTITRSYPDLRTYGADLTIPASLMTVKGEAAYFASPSSTTEEFVLYVIELERQTGEWLLDGGYAGEVVTMAGAGRGFNPERGLARSFIGRAAYTVDPNRSVAIEGAVRQTGAGGFIKGDYSQTIGRHLRLTLTGVGIAGDEDDFIGQYQRNSHVSVGLRFSF